MPYFEETLNRWPELWKSLGNALTGERLGHAFLISSDRTATREDFALALAALACCANSAVTGKPCGTCAACRQLAQGNYPELHELSPVGKGYQIQIGDRQNPEPNTVRFFEEQFFLTGTSGASRKVGIIHDADRMNSESQNALLKTLEEPPPETMIILTTGNPASLLPTTRSRCQHLRLLENRIEFDFPGANELFDTLDRLFFDCNGDLAEAESAAESLIKISASLRESSETRAESEWEGKISQAADFDPALAKRLDKQQQDAASGEYMRLRRDFLSAIHSYTAQQYLLSGGAEMSQLPNPEIMRRTGLPVKQTEKLLKQADELLFNLRFNVNEELALRNFAVQCAMAVF